MKENTLIKLKSLLLNRRREMLEQVAHLEFESAELGQHLIESIEKHTIPKEGQNV
jgi:negative regulator of sigma E activity